MHVCVLHVIYLSSFTSLVFPFLGLSVMCEFFSFISSFLCINVGYSELKLVKETLIAYNHHLRELTISVNISDK